MAILHESTETTVCFWCPGCGNAHCVSNAWTIDRDTVTISPSVLVKGSPWENNVCHSFVRAGQIEFLTDSTHALAGQTVPLPDWH